MASLVHKTIYSNPAGTENLVLNLSSTSTPGNWLVMFVGGYFGRQYTYVTDQGESFTAIGITSAGGSFGHWFLLQSTKSCSSITFTDGNISHLGVVAYVGLYEVTGTALQYVNQGGVDGGVSNSIHAFEQSTTGSSVMLVR